MSLNYLQLGKVNRNTRSPRSTTLDDSVESRFGNIPTNLLDCQTQAVILHNGTLSRQFIVNLRLLSLPELATYLPITCTPLLRPVPVPVRFPILDVCPPSTFHVAACFFLLSFLPF